LVPVDDDQIPGYQAFAPSEVFARMEDLITSFQSLKQRIIAADLFKNYVWRIAKCEYAIDRVYCF